MQLAVEQKEQQLFFRGQQHPDFRALWTPGDVFLPRCWDSPRPRGKPRQGRGSAPFPVTSPLHHRARQKHTSGPRRRGPVPQTPRSVLQGPLPLSRRGSCRWQRPGTANPGLGPQPQSIPTQSCAAERPANRRCTWGWGCAKQASQWTLPLPGAGSWLAGPSTPHPWPPRLPDPLRQSSAPPRPVTQCPGCQSRGSRPPRWDGGGGVEKGRKTQAPVCVCVCVRDSKGLRTPPILTGFQPAKAPSSPTERRGTGSPHLKGQPQQPSTACGCLRGPNPALSLGPAASTPLPPTCS